MAKVKIPPILRPATGEQREVVVSGVSIGVALGSLAVAYPELKENLFDGEGELNQYLNVYLNDEDVRVLEGMETPVSDSDVIVILPAMAGGS